MTRRPDELTLSSLTRRHPSISNTHEMLLPPQTFLQVRKAKTLVIVLLYIIILSSRAVFAFPNRPVSEILEHRNKITVQTSGCRPLTTEELRTMMGGAFDSATMSYDDESAKRSASDSPQSVIGTSGDETDDEVEDFFDDEEALEDLDTDSNKKSTVGVQPRQYMRRKRHVNVQSLDTKSYSYVDYAVNTISKRKSRNRRDTNSKKFHPAWECRKQKRWLKMKKGYFPSRILDGQCQTDSCFFGIYSCNPVKYAIKVLKRDPEDACKPVPLVGQNTTYEESWSFKRIHVTVACECGQSWTKKKRNRKRS